jgi:hypothetical protein
MKSTISMILELTALLTYFLPFAADLRPIDYSTHRT